MSVHTHYVDKNGPTFKHSTWASYMHVLLMSTLGCTLPIQRNSSMIMHGATASNFRFEGRVWYMYVCVCVYVYVSVVLCSSDL